MKPVSLKQLVTITPLNNKTKQKTLKSLPTLSETGKFKLSQICWKAISLHYQVLVKEKIDQMFKQMAMDEASYEKQDFVNAENEIFNKLLVKIDETQSQEEAETIKAKLKTPDSPPPVN